MKRQFRVHLITMDFEKKGNMDFEKIEKETTVNVSYEQILWRLGMNDEKV